MIAKCGNCRYWQGNKYTTYSDCYRVCGVFAPDLFKFKNSVSNYRFNIPFDPNDLKTEGWQEACIRDEEYNWIYFTDVYKSALKKAKKTESNFIQTRDTFWCHYYKKKERK